MELDHEFTVPVPIDQAWSVLLDVERIAPCMPGATLDSIDGDEFTGRLKVRLGAMTITYKGSARIASKDAATRTVTLEGSGKEARGAGTATAAVQARLHDKGESTRVAVHTKLNVTGRPAQFGRGILAEVGGKLIGRFAESLAEEISRDRPTAEPEATPASETAAGPEAVPTSETAAEPGVDAEPGTAAPGKPDTARNADVGSPSNPPVTASPGRADARPEVPAPAARTRPERPSAEAIDLLEVAGPSIVKRLVAPLLGGLLLTWALRRLLRRR